MIVNFKSLLCIVSWVFRYGFNSLITSWDSEFQIMDVLMNNLFMTFKRNCSTRNSLSPKMTRRACLHNLMWSARCCLDCFHANVNASLLLYYTVDLSSDNCMKKENTHTTKSYIISLKNRKKTLFSVSDTVRLFELDKTPPTSYICHGDTFSGT